MPPDNVLFFGALFFLIGVFLSSVGFNASIVLIVAAVEVVLLILWLLGEEVTVARQRFTPRTFLWLSGLALLVLVGALYYTWDNIRFQSARVPFVETTTFTGIIIDDPTPRGTAQEVVVELEPPYSGRVLLKVPRYPELRYGDRLAVTGTVEAPFPDGYARYLAKERVSGIATYPEVEVTGHGGGALLKTKLFDLKHRVIGVFQRVLPAREAALLSGLTVGERSEFTQEFREAMQRSGTTHLVALSGYNITIVAWAAMGLLLYFLSRRLAFLGAVLVIAGFVAMTGAEASVVRAAVMGFLVLLSREIGRTYDFRNAITLAALLMVFANPKVLAFDIGFQLSFLALLGIVYLRPAIARLLRLSEEPGFLSWRDNLLTTASAQLAVAPVVITQFGGFSPTSLLANVLVLEPVPLTMGLGFVTGALGLVSYHASLVTGWLAWVLLRFEILVIEFFARISIPIGVTMSWVVLTAYYLLLVAFVIYVRHHQFRHPSA